jgi:mannose-6-phosphate isomerase-like protein (cupin superfamily)
MHANAASENGHQGNHSGAAVLMKAIYTLETVMPTVSRFFDILTLAATLPETAETMLTDIRLTDEPAASCRIFRVHRPAPAHYHTCCDEYLYVLSGRAEIVIADNPPREIKPGELVFFKKNTVHALPKILEEPFTVLAIDTPRRPPEDVHFVNPEDGTPESFIRTQY